MESTKYPGKEAESRGQRAEDGSIVGPNDLLIAATVIASNGTLATRNTKEFSRVHGLKLVEW